MAHGSMIRGFLGPLAELIKNVAQQQSYADIMLPFKWPQRLTG